MILSLLSVNVLFGRIVPPARQPASGYCNRVKTNIDSDQIPAKMANFKKKKKKKLDNWNSFSLELKVKGIFPSFYLFLSISQVFMFKLTMSEPIYLLVLVG